jgi:hypothetical protein
MEATMDQTHTLKPAGAPATLPPIEIPPFEPPTEEELARRTVLFEQARRLREEIGPIDIAADELLYLARSEAEE